LEFAARNPRRYGSVVGLSGGLIGPPGVPRHDQGDLAGTPVFLGCSDMDPHIPLARVHETAAVLTGMGAQVTTRIYPGMGHTVNQDELARVTALLDALDSTQPD
jgi:predicted esterase